MNEVIIYELEVWKLLDSNVIEGVMAFLVKERPGWHAVWCILAGRGRLAEKEGKQEVEVVPSIDSI